MSFKKGFTLFEIIIAISILLIIIALALPKFSEFRTVQIHSSSIADVLSSLDQARRNTLNSLDSSSYGVHFETSKIVIFKGTAYSAQDANNIDVLFASPSSITNITLSGGGSDIYFNRLTGTPNKTGSITISTGSYAKIITIGATGIFSSN